MNLLIYFHNYPILNKYIIISKGLQWALSEATHAIRGYRMGAHAIDKIILRNHLSYHEFRRYHTCPPYQTPWRTASG